MNPGKPVNRSNVFTAMWADLMGPFIGENKIPEEQKAQMMLLAAVRALLHDTVTPIIGDATTATYQQAQDINTVEEWRSELEINIM